MIKQDVLRFAAIVLFCLALTTLAQSAPTQESPEAAEKNFKDGITALEAGDGAQAVALFTKAIELNPDWAEAYVNRGQVYTITGARLQLGSPFEALYNRGRVHTKQGKSDQAVADYTAALKPKPIPPETI